MSASGQEQTLGTLPFNVGFLLESGRSHGMLGTSADSQLQTLLPGLCYKEATAISSLLLQRG